MFIHSVATFPLVSIMYTYIYIKNINYQIQKNLKLEPHFYGNNIKSIHCNELFNYIISYINPLLAVG